MNSLVDDSNGKAAVVSQMFQDGSRVNTTLVLKKESEESRLARFINSGTKTI